MSNKINEVANKITDNLPGVVEQFKDKAPELVKSNKGALIGAVIGYLLTENKEAQSALIGAIAGAVIIDNKKEK